jgi:hypothetical protein
MDRELMLAALVCLLCGPALLAAGALRPRLRRVESARALERHAWRRIWLPLLPAALVLAFLVGWALQEPEQAEGIEPVLLLPAALFGFHMLRAVLRAVRALRAPAHGPVAMTAGLWRPRIHIAPELAARLDEHALRAALAHEVAHARHHDPLRLWLAQLATDLQWPLTAAPRRRFADWREALELARDAEACEHVEGSDLAAALIEAARLSRARVAGTAVGLVAEPDGARAFAERIHRLLDRPAADTAGAASTTAATATTAAAVSSSADAEADAAGAPPRGRSWAWALLAALGAAVAVGGLLGESIVERLPGLCG